MRTPRLPRSRGLGSLLALAASALLATACAGELETGEVGLADEGAGDAADEGEGEGEGEAGDAGEADGADAPLFDGDEEEAIGEAGLPLSAEGAIRVAQANPFWAGRYPKGAWAKSSEYRANHKNSWATMEAFASDVVGAPQKRPISVVGMQEVNTPELSAKVEQILEQGTGKPWAHRHFWKKTGSSQAATGEAIFWRDDLVEELESFGTKEVRDIDAKSGKKNALSVRFGGLLLRKRGTSRAFGVFTGKLTWRGQKDSGVPVKDAHRAKEIDVLQRWIGEKMAAHPRSSRVVLMDMNAAFHSKPWWHMRDHYYDGDVKRSTYLGSHFPKGTRLDYVFWDYDAGPKRKDGFLGKKPWNSVNYGSDHLAVIADVYVRADDASDASCKVRCCDGALKVGSSESEKACRDSWKVCADNGYADRIAFRGEVIYDKPTCGD